MEKKYSIEEILSAVQDLNNLKKNTSKIVLEKPKKTKQRIRSNAL